MRRFALVLAAFAVMPWNVRAVASAAAATPVRSHAPTRVARSMLEAPEPAFFTLSQTGVADVRVRRVSAACVAVRDIGDAVPARLPLLTVRRLSCLVGVLALLAFVLFVWCVLLRHRIRWLTRTVRHTLENKAARERRLVQIQKERVRALEAINSRMPLEQVLGMVSGFAGELLGNVTCWWELADGRVVGDGSGQVASAIADSSCERRDILSSGGERLGVLILARGSSEAKRDAYPAAADAEAVDICVSMAALAIDSRRLYEQLIHRSEYDQLTQAPNRFLMGARLAEALTRGKEFHHRFALIYIDLDRFKQINDRYGHHVGDVYLQHVTQRLLERLRPSDTLARVGGDEFLVLMPVVRDRGEADEVAKRLEQCFDSPFSIDGRTFCGAASFGVSMFPDDGEDEEQLQRSADERMYIRKRLGADGRE